MNKKKLTKKKLNDLAKLLKSQKTSQQFIKAYNQLKKKYPTINLYFKRLKVIEARVSILLDNYLFFKFSNNTSDIIESHEWRYINLKED